MAKTFSQKNWYPILAPEMFGGNEIGVTPADQGADVTGRVLKIELKEAQPKADKYYVDLFLRIYEVKQGQAHTELIGHTCSKEFLYRLVRKNTNKIESVLDVKTKDGKKVRVKSVGITIKRAHREIVRDLRAMIVKNVKADAKANSFDAFMKSVFANAIQLKVLKEAKPIYPLRSFEIRMTEVR